MMEKAAGIWALVPAAGSSRRMGEPKLLLPYRGRTVIEAVLEAAEASRVERTLVVLGRRIGRVEGKIARFAVRLTRNPRPAEGMLSSVQRGFRALPRSVRAAVVLLGDQPWVKASTIDRLVEAYLGGSRGLVCPVHGGKGGHPLLVDVRYREDVARLDPAEGLRGLLRLHPEDLLRLEVEEPDILEDLDGPEDLIKLGRL